ncbi:MAG: 23S rRNA (uracil(1939)-C(5))-methyltransferase RlmD [Solirubrobacterales bacterium]|nr:23S rRNA (uracil(1939)-C(5))-methyltransferase RlmD [Solirubrobacterales bacterium]
MEPASGATRTRPSRGDELQLTVDSLAFGGAGVARLDGYVVFVADGIPGDRVRAVVEKSKRAYAQARAVELIEPSPERVAPRAAHPGAPWQVLPYERQIEAKQAQVDDALRRIGRLEGFELEPIVPADEVWRYRNKLEYSFGRDGDGRLVCGFHAPGRWEEIVEVTDCLLASDAGNAARERVVEWCRSRGLAAYDRRTGEGFLRNLVVRESRRGGELQVRLVTSPGRLDTDGLALAAEPVDGLLWTQLDSVAETTQGGHTELIAGSDRLEEEIGGMRIQISPHAFFQTNTEMAARLYRLAIDYAAPAVSDRVYDLYCGIGTIGLLMAPRAGEVWGLEIVEEAIADAIANARLNEIDNARFFAGDVRLAMRDLVDRAGRPDVLIVDPPRSGLSQKIVRRVIEAGPRRVVYVSCNPTTLAPNAAQLVEDGGYRLRRVRAVDMFPQTPHIECVALLERADD